MNPRTLRSATLAVALAAASALAGCSKKVTEPAKPPAPTPPPPAQNVAPDTWFAGPDPTDPAAGWQIAPGGGRYVDAPASGWRDFPGIPQSQLSVDSLLLLPKQRPARRTFFEVYADRLWLHQEGDTVHTNSYVIFPAGGSDPDSPYAVLVNEALLPPWLYDYPVLKPDTANGSPIGFRLRIQLKDVLGRVDSPSESTTYPVYDPASVFHNPVINGYHLLTDAGRAYAVVRAVDGDGAVDRRIDHQPGDAVGVADRVDAGAGSPQDVALRSKILTFYVDHAPRLSQDAPVFRPVANQVFTSRTLRSGSDLGLYAVDDDPYDVYAPARPGGPGVSAILRRRIAVLGKSATDPPRDTCWVAPGDFVNAAVGLTIPDWIANGPITLLVRLCDCYSCDVLPGPGACPAFAGQELRPTFGTCVDTSIPCQLAVPGPTAAVDR